MSQLRFDNKVVIVTGAGGGLGKQYALFFGSRGAKVVVNDLGGSLHGESNKKEALRPADQVVLEIKQQGGQAVANYDSVVDGDKIVKTAVDAYGKVDIVINNAGILRDISFQKMSEKDWDLIMQVHLKGTFSVTRAAWNLMREQNFGRIVNTASAAGLYGNFGQANYAAAKLGIHGFTQAIAREGQKKNIYANSICPIAASRMTETVLPKEALDQLKPDYVVPLVAYLCHDTCKENGSVFEVGAGYMAKLRWQRSQGAFFDLPFSPEQVGQRWSQVVDFNGNNEHPTSMNDVFPKFNENLERIKAGQPAEQSNNNNNNNNTKPKVATSIPSLNVQKGGVQLKSEEIFSMMSSYIDLGEAKPQVSKVAAVFNFNIILKKGGPVQKSWVIDLKNNQGKVIVGTDKDADATFMMTDNDFEQVCLGTLNPQMAFIQGKMKIKGNMKKAGLFTPELFPKPTAENKAKYNKPKL